MGVSVCLSALSALRGIEQPQGLAASLFPSSYPGWSGSRTRSPESLGSCRPKFPSVSVSCPLRPWLPRAPGGGLSLENQRVECESRSYLPSPVTLAHGSWLLTSCSWVKRRMAPLVSGQVLRPRAFRGVGSQERLDDIITPLWQSESQQPVRI